MHGLSSCWPQRRRQFANVRAARSREKRDNGLRRTSELSLARTCFSHLVRRLRAHRPFGRHCDMRPTALAPVHKYICVIRAYLYVWCMYVICVNAYLQLYVCMLVYICSMRSFYKCVYDCCVYDCCWTEHCTDCPARRVTVARPDAPEPTRVRGAT